MRGIPQGWFKASVTTSEAVECPWGFSCTTTEKTACDAMKYSLAGWSDCFRVPVGTEAGGAALEDCTTNSYDRETSSCLAATFGLYDPFTGLSQSCQVGFYFLTSTATDCTICPIGKFCEDGIDATNADENYPAANTQEIFGEIGCPPGFECTTSTMTELDPGEWSYLAEFEGTEEDYLVQSDLSATNSGGDCPSESFRTAVRLSCTPSSFQNTPLNDGDGDPTSEEGCGAAEIAWIMSSCVTLAQNDDYHFESDETKVYSGVHCPTGWDAWYNDDPGVEDYVCTFWGARSNVAVDYVKGKAE